MSRMNSLMIAMAGAMMVMGDHTATRNFNPTPTKRIPENREELAEYISSNALRADSRQLREFSVQGHRIMAYSKKDAITRLRHQKLI